MAASAVSRLTLSQFRCYEQARLTVPPGPVVLTGPNGAGKTNLLEALSLLAPGRGLRRARLSQMARLGAPGATGWAVAATVETPFGPVEIGTGQDGVSSERRLLRIDGQSVRGQARLAAHVAVVWLTPQMDRLFLEGPSGRRRFLDRLAFGFDPAHAGRLSRYESVLRERGRLLRDGSRDAAWLAALEDQMATTGIAVACARRDMVERLRIGCAQALGPFPRASLALDGVVDRWLAERPALVAEDLFRAALAAARGQDSGHGGADGASAAVGPHRSDLVVHWQGDDDRRIPAELCSTGEQKALLIAIVLANTRLMAVERGHLPLLLLDEVAAHLDPLRRRALFAELLDLGAQAWLTGTEDTVFSDLRGVAAFWRVEAARLRQDEQDFTQ
ncbi:MAG: DNA replication/repair protein RecF [Azospirillaceae bacterium]|nr:DNA replication/repair protein RecF [Azospirillaceae bacterium]